MRHGEIDAGGDEVAVWLAERDAALGVRWRSLEPGRTDARSLADLVPDRALGPDVRMSIARGIVRIAEAMHRNFPSNLFGDLDVVLARLERGGSEGGASRVEAAACTIVELHDLFGHQTTIQFRYVHDFLYGFDWARWVRRDPASRASIGPFDEPFLSYVGRRGHELMALIAEDDPKYHRIARGSDRNPFAFHRDPESEAALLCDLAAGGWVPIEAWRRDAEPCWDRDYVAAREARARALGLAR